MEKNKMKSLVLTLAILGVCSFAAIAAETKPEAEAQPQETAELVVEETTEKPAETK